MLSPENYQKLREKIIETVPKIMELKFGCEVRFNAYNEVFVYLRKSLKGNEIIKKGGERISIVSISDVEILGRPIRLSDVLRALNYRRKLVDEKYSIDTKGYLTSFDKNWFPKNQVEWNLSIDDLDSQSDEVKTFLYELLK